jgi:hypothetical protein
MLPTLYRIDDYRLRCKQCGEIFQPPSHEDFRNWRKIRCPKIPIVFMGSPALPCPYCWFVHYPADIHKYLPDEAFVMETADGTFSSEDGKNGICHLFRNASISRDLKFEFDEQFTFESSYRVCAWNCDILNETDPSGNWTWSHDRT